MSHPPPSSIADSDVTAGRDGGGGAGWATDPPPPSPAAWRTAAPLIAAAASTPRGAGLTSLLAAVGEDGSAEEAARRPPAEAAAKPPPPPRPHPRRPSLLARLADAGGGSGRNALQVAVGVALAALPSVLGPGWSPAFPAACTAPTYTLICLLMMSPAAAVGVRFINVASLLGPAALGSMAGGGAVSLAVILDRSAGFGFAAALAALAIPILATAAVVRGAQHAPPYVAGMGLVITLSAGSTMLGAASALAAARNAALSAAAGGLRTAPLLQRGALHAHWWLTVAPTLAAFGVAGAATAVASLLLPALASTDAEAVTARALGGCGEALSHTAARLFAVAADPGLMARSASTGAPLPPAGAGAAALPPVSLDGKTGAEGGAAPLLLMQREPVDAPAFEAWWARLCAPIDVAASAGGGGGGSAAGPGGGAAALTDRLASGLESIISLSRRRPTGKGGGPPPLLPPVPPPPDALGDGHKAAVPSLADPGPPIGSLRPLLAAARAALAASTAEPPLLRGWRARPFCPAAWERLLTATDGVVTALSALQSVAGDDTALAETRQLYPPRLTACLRGALAAAAACLARLAARVEGEVAVGEEEEEGGAAAAVAAADAAAGLPPPTSPPPPPPPLSPGEDGTADGTGEDWPALLDGLRAAFAESINQYVSRARSATPGSPVVLPSAYTARSHAFAYVAAAAVVSRVAELDAAAEAALGCGCSASASSKARHHHSHPATARPVPLAWVGALARIALCMPVWRATARAARGGVRRLGRLGRVLTSSAWRRREAAPPPGDAHHHSRHHRRRRRRPGPRPWRNAVASLKYFLTVWAALTATLFAINASPALARLGPVAGFTAAALTASDKVEASVSKSALWAVSSLVGGLVGGGLASIHGLSPPAVAGVLTSCAGVVGVGARTGFRTAATLTLLTLSSVALCEASGTAGAAACAARGRAASPWCGPGAGGPGVRPVPVWTAVWGRTASVLAGVLLAQTVCVFLLPWYVTDWALASISAAIRDAAEPFMEAQAVRFIGGGRDAWLKAAAARGQQAAVEDGGAGGDDDDEEAPRQALRPVYGLVDAIPDPLPPAGLDPRPLLDGRGRRVVAALDASGLQAFAVPLVDVQAALARDAAAWQRGVLATPPSVRVVLRSALSLLDALAALSFALDPAIVGGGSHGASLTGVLFEAYTARTFPEICAVFEALRTLVDAIARHAVAVHPHRAGWLECMGSGVGGGGGGGGASDTNNNPRATPRRRRAARTRADLEAALAGLVSARRRSIAAQAAARRFYHAEMVKPTSGVDGARAADTFRAPADVVRHLAFMGALIKCSNRLQAVAAAVLRV